MTAKTRYRAGFLALLCGLLIAALVGVVLVNSAWAQTQAGTPAAAAACS